MIASLGMYDRPETAEANDRLWAGIRDRLRSVSKEAPDTLTRGAGAYWAAWQAPDLLLSQTCGFPYRSILHGKVKLVATPDYGVEGCPPGYYCSVLVARAQDPRDQPAAFNGAAFAYNEALSQSGWAAPQNLAASMGFYFRPALASGGHKLSAQAVAEGRADIAAIDAVTWEMLRRWEPFAGGLKVVGRTPPTPGLPLITAPHQDAGLLFSVVEAAIAGLSAEDRGVLQLRGVVRIAPEAYLAVPTPPSPDQFAHSS